MSYTRIIEPTILAGWTSGISLQQYSAYVYYPLATEGQIIGRLTSSDDYLLMPDNTEIYIPSSGYTRLDLEGGVRCSSFGNFVVSPNLVNDLSGSIYYFQASPQGLLFKAGCEGGEWQSDLQYISLKLHSSGDLELVSASFMELHKHGYFKPGEVVSIIISCGLKVVSGLNTTFVFDGIATPTCRLTNYSDQEVIQRCSSYQWNFYNPTADNLWSQYDSSGSPWITYYVKSETITTYTPVRYEILSFDDQRTTTTYTIPYLRDHFTEKLGQQLTINRISAYKHQDRTQSNHILDQAIADGYVYTTFNMTISDFSNSARGGDGSSIYLYYSSQPTINYFYWDNNDGSLDSTLIDTGKTISTGLTAASWTRLQAKCREVQTAFGLSPSTFTTVHTGDLILASYYMEIRNALARLPSAAVPVLPPSVATGDVIRAYLFNGNVIASQLSLKFVLNAAISYYNDNY